MPLLREWHPMANQELAYSLAAQRNKAPILEVLRRVLAPEAAVLEIAAGTGQHAEHFAGSRSGWQWQPTEADETALAAIAARCAHLPNVRPPVRLDVLAAAWPPVLGRFDAVYCANMLHIAPWRTCAALMQGACRHLAPGGLLVLYGPYFVDGEAAAPSNLAFDADLRARNAEWGLRRLGDVVDEAQSAGLAFQQRFDLPANNLALVFRDAS
jgi:SAM-dependent methyltransferase